MFNFASNGTSANIDATLNQPYVCLCGDCAAELGIDAESLARNQAEHEAYLAQANRDVEELFAEKDFNGNDFEDSIVDFDEANAVEVVFNHASNHVDGTARFAQSTSVSERKCTYQINFPRTSLAPDRVEYMTSEGLDNGYETPPLELCAFTLIENRLVPETFIERVKNEFRSSIVDYGFVLSETSIFDEQFLASLDENERAVLMSVVMLLVARDEFPMNLWTDNGTTY